jgi:acetolactate synthase-1/2/3 large subunit
MEKKKKTMEKVKREQALGVRDAVDVNIPTGKMKMPAAAAIAKILELRGVDRAFGVPGAAILPVYDALRESQIDSYVVRHEQTAAFAADAHYRVTGKVGVCLATSGPGGTNLVTGLYTAWFDSIPMIALTGQVVSSAIGTAAFQEAPITAIAAPVTKRAFLPKTAEEIPALVNRAFNIASTGKMGPILIDLPVDLQKALIAVDFSALGDEGKEAPPLASDQDVEKAATMLLKAQMPVIIAGGGVILAEATSLLREFAEMLSIPVTSSLMGKGSLPADHPLYAGGVGTMCNSPLGNKTLLESDLILNLGGRFGDRHTGKVSTFLRAAKVIHVNIDPIEIGKAVVPDLGIVSDVKYFLERMIEVLRREKKERIPQRTEQVHQLAMDRIRLARRLDFDQIPIKPQRAIKELREFLDRDAIVTHDIGISQIWSAQLFDAYEPRSYLVTGGAGPMGWGLGAAIAAKLAKPERQCVNFVGDGSLCMSLQDLATAAMFHIPIVVFVVNNSLLGLIRQQQNLFYGGRHISTFIGYEQGGLDRGLDFVKVAEGMGLAAERVEKPEGIKPALARAFASGRPYLIDVIADRGAVCSMSLDGTLTGVKETD